MHIVLGSSPKVFFEFPLHRHDCWEILLSLTGTGTATIDGQDYPFREGTIFCIPPGVAHCKHAPDGYTDGSIFTQDFTPPDERAVPVFQDDADGTFRQLYEAAFRLHLRSAPNAARTIDAIASALYQLMLGWSSMRMSRCPAVEAFQRLLLDNLSNCAFDLTEAIASTGYCASYFRKLFKAETGFAPVVYFNRMRVEYAKTLLRQSDGQRPVKEIAAAAGFSDPYYFSRVFKSCTGMSPSGYLAEPFDRARIQGTPEYRNGSLLPTVAGAMNKP